VLERREGNDGIVFGLARGANQWTVFVDKLPTEGGHTGLEMVDNQMLTLQRGMQITTGQPATFDFRVRKSGVTAMKDGKPLFSWQGNTTRLGNYKNWAVPNPKALFLGQWWNTVRYTEIKLTPISGEGRLLRGAGAASPKKAAGSDPDSTPPGFVSLMPLIDVQKDTVAGTWRMVDGKLTCDNAERAKLEIPYRPPAEYDFRIVFTRIEGSSDVNQILSKSGKPFAWCMGGMSNTNSGFGMINGKWAPEPPNPSLVKFGVEQGRTYVSIVEVRKDGLKATVNGSLVSQWKTNYGDMDLQDAWRLRDSSALGLGTFHSPTTFHKIEIREVTGRGKTTR